MPLRVFIVTGTSYGAAAATACSRISPSSLRFHGQRAAAALAGHLGDRAAEVEVDVRDAVLRAQDLGGLADVDRVGAVELHRAHRLQLVEDQHVQGVLVPLDHAAAGDHLADVEAGSLLGAQPAVRRVGDPRHRREHHGRRHLQRAEGETGHASIVGRAAGTLESWQQRQQHPHAWSDARPASRFVAQLGESVGSSPWSPWSPLPPLAGLSGFGGFGFSSSPVQVIGSNSWVGPEADRGRGRPCWARGRPGRPWSSRRA